MLSELQTKILNSKSNAIFVQAAAASGKTRLLVERIKQDVLENKGKVIAFTFTNAAAEEMLERLEDVDKTNLFIGTIHSYCFRLLLVNGIDEGVQYVEDKDFDKLFPLIKRHQACIQPVYSVLCDEMQDCNADQFDFIFKLLKTDKYFCCYDPRQSIYRWRDAHPEYIDKYIDQLNAEVFYLNENFRNAPEILQFAKSLIQMAGYDYIDRSIAKRTFKGRVCEVEYSPHAVVKAIKKFGKFGSWFILTRTNDQIEEIMHTLQIYDVPCISFKRSQLNNKELYAKMKEDAVKVLTIHTSKGLEADHVVVIGAKFYNTEEKCISYVAATRARNLLVWTRMPNRARKARMDCNWES